MQKECNVCNELSSEINPVFQCPRGCSWQMHTICAMKWNGTCPQCRSEYGTLLDCVEFFDKQLVNQDLAEAVEDLQSTNEELEAELALEVKKNMKLEEELEANEMLINELDLKKKEYKAQLAIKTITIHHLNKQNKLLKRKIKQKKQSQINSYKLTSFWKRRAHYYKSQSK